jgi:SAM-dependent methyltransferase
MEYVMPKASREENSKDPNEPEKASESNADGGSLASATFSDYHPSRGPTQRRGLLKDIWNQRFGESFDSAKLPDAWQSAQHAAKERAPLVWQEVRFPISQREVRRAVKEMFSFEPLVNPSRTELSLLKNWALSAVGSFMQRNREKVYKIGSSPEQPHSMSDEQPQRADLLSMLSNGESYSKTAGLSYYWSRGLRDYREKHRVPVDDIIGQLSAGKSKLQILDLGSMTSQMLSEVKDIFIDTIVTHGLSPFHCPQYKVDHFHCLYGEYLPKSFANQFDLIVSQRAIEYAMFPDLILENIVQSLAPGGEAYLQWQPGRFILNYHYPELVQQYLDCVNAKMRSVKGNHTEVKVEPNGTPVEILCGEQLWFHKVEELQGRRGLTVLDYEDQPLKARPFCIKIRKNE